MSTVAPPTAPPESAAPTAPLPDDLQALWQAEHDAVRERRRQWLGGTATPADLAAPRVGLALSGGGLRSATFALGLMRGLARVPARDAESPAAGADAGIAAPAPAPAPDGNGPAPPLPDGLSAGGLLGRIDYLSTVSGGGYAGAMWGRLVHTYGMACAMRQMARSDSPLLQWLRHNGRYLTPSGSRDIGIAAVTYLRPVLAIHAEFMFACMLLGLVVVMPHLLQHSTGVLQADGWERWFTPWWAMALALWAATAPGTITGYWAARDGPNPDARGVGPPWRDWLFLLGATLGSYALLCALLESGSLNPLRDSLNGPSAAVLALVSGVLGQAAVQVWLAGTREPYALAVARVRNVLTRGLRVCTLAALALAALGLLDRGSWWVLEELQSGNEWLWGGVGLGGVIVLVLRTLMQPLQQVAAEANANALKWLPRLLNLAGWVGMLVLVMAWMVALQWFVFAPDTFTVFVNVPAWLRALLVAGVWLLWVLLTAGNAQMANTSALHSFYRARLTRAYLAVGNRNRGFDGSATRRADVTVVVEGDDTALHHYRPETQGGPIHLVNTCLNQTRDDQSGLYNADRKGTALTVTWRGMEVGPQRFIAIKPGYDVATLGRWVALSGAAASPGAGSYTSRGLALLVYFLGVRLGQWVRAPHESVELRWLSRWAWRFIPKPMMLTSEASATFFGVERPWWYLSDGGHFENTGAYTLIKRELDFIVLADASCDCAYEFGDLENLVRKARIDFGAEIEFYSREEAARLICTECRQLTVLSPEDLADNHSWRGVLLARIRYRERPGPDGQPHRPEGTLLVIKPNLHDGLDVDLLAYAQKHPAFPHESTGDQSFDEAQWESYHRLGEDFGRVLTDDWLAQLPGWRSPARHGVHVATRLRAANAPADTSKTEPLWRRGARATAVGTTLGLGASGTVLLSLWQVQEQLRRNQVDQQSEARQLFTEVSKGLQGFNGGCPKVPEHLVTQVSLLLDLRESPVMRPLERAGVERLAARIGDECTKPVEPSEECLLAHQRMQSDLCATVLKQPTENTALNYWHPGVSPAEQAVATRKLLAELGGPWWLAPASRSARTDAPGGPAPVPEPRGPVASIGGVAGAGGDVAGGASPRRSPLDTARDTLGGVLPPGPVASSPVPGPSPAPPVSPPLPLPNLAANAAPTEPSAFAATLQAACGRAGHTTLYIQVYDEASRAAARGLRRTLQLDGDGALLVAPTDNVNRSAELRGERRPVPWPKPTFVMHDPASRACAMAMSRYLGEPWVRPGETDKVWLRGLPASLKKSRNVRAEGERLIELWLPPLVNAPSRKS